MDFLLRRVVPFLVYGYLTVVGWTSRVRWDGREHLQALRKQGKNFIYAFWHAKQAMFTYTHRGQPVAIMVSKSKDGDIIANVMAHSRIRAVRGSSSRAAIQGTLELIDAAKQGYQPGFTPDGPKGPPRKVKSGVIYLAQKTGLPIVPITNAVSRKLIMKRAWDRFEVPLPFSDVRIVHGEPIRVSPGDDAEAKARELESALNRITAEAEARVAG